MDETVLRDLSPITRFDHHIRNWVAHTWFEASRLRALSLKFNRDEQARGGWRGEMLPLGFKRIYYRLKLYNAQHITNCRRVRNPGVVAPDYRKRTETMSVDF